ncbi:MAG: phage tail protein [Thermoanaerobaculia bacterium]
MKRERIAELLPTVFRRALPHSPPLAAVLGVMEAMHRPSENALAHFGDALNPRTAPDRFVPFLASWTGLDFVSEGATPIDLSRLRELIAMSSILAKWRGTATGLILFVEIATGLRGFSVEEPRPFHFVLHAPLAALPWQELIERIVVTEKPAYVTSDVVYG